MKLIYTNDGLIGLNINGKIIWAANIQEAVGIAFGHYSKLQDPPTKAELEHDITYAINHMRNTGDSIAEFGVFGTFMYTTTEPEYEF